MIRLSRHIRLPSGISKGGPKLCPARPLAYLLAHCRTHLPVMFIGMQYLLLSNVKAADEYLDAAYSMCQSDPLLLNERGVSAYYSGRSSDAINLFSLALEYAGRVQADPASWAGTHANLGQTYRQLGRYREAADCFRRCIELQPDNAEAHAALGLNYLYVGLEEDAILSLHKVRPSRVALFPLLSFRPFSALWTSQERIADSNA